MLFNSSLKRLLTLNFILTATLPILAIGIVSIHVLSSSIKKEVSNRNYLLAKSLAGEVERFLEEPAGLLKQVRDNIDRKNLISTENVSSYLDSIIRNYRFFEMLTILDRNGRIKHLSPFSKGYLDTDMTGHMFYRNTGKAEIPYWSRTFISIQTGQPTLTISIPLKNGMVVGYINLAALNDVIDKVQTGFQGKASIIDNDGTIIAHMNRTLAAQRMNVRHYGFVRNALEGREGTFEYVSNGEKRIGSVAVISHTGWLVGVTQPEKEAFETVQRIAVIITAGTVITLAVAVFIALICIRKALKPLILFTEKTRQITQGDYSLVPETKGYQEVKTLSHNFKVMADAVKKRENDLIESRNYVKNIFDSMPSILVSVDSSARIIEWNEEAEKASTLSLRGGEIICDAFPELSSGLGDLNESIRKKTHNKIEKYKITDENNVKYLDIDIYPFTESGFEGAVIRIDDVTGKVRIEEIMIQTEKMMSVGGLAAGMAHEINNPLAGILQNAQLIQTRISKDTPANIRAAEECGTTIETINSFMDKRDIVSMLDKIRNSGLRAAKIVENMLSFSRKSESSVAANNLKDIIDKTVELAENDYDLKKKYDFRKIEIIREYAPSLPDIPCEKTKIQQVLLNLLKNSAQAMTGNTKHPRITLRLHKNDTMVTLEVKDNGPGMDENVRKRVFEPFFTTKDTNIGTGLGLSVSYFIITEDHNGTMTVESSPGAGTTFTIRLPIKESG